jgi:hypothetical protein
MGCSCAIPTQLLTSQPWGQKGRASMQSREGAPLTAAFVSHAPSAPPSTVLSVALLATATISCGLFFYFVNQTAIRVPVYDMLDWLPFYDDRARANDWLGYLWAPHNEHRLVFTRALIAVDIRSLGGQGTAFAIFDTLLWIFVVLDAWRIVFNDGRSLAFRVFACSVALLILSPTYIATTISMPGPGAFMQTPSFAFFALVLLHAQTESRIWRLVYRSGAIACACFSSFGVAAGLLIWPVLSWSAWRGRLERPWIVAIVSSGLFFVTLYLWRLPPKTYQSPSSLENLLTSVDYGIRFLGLPWAHAEQLAWPARAIGIIVAVIGANAIVKSTVIRQRASRAEGIGAALIMFAFLVALAASFGRVDTYGPIPVRYAMFLVLAHLGLFFWALPYIQTLWEVGRARALQWAAVVLAVAWLAHQIVVGEMARAEADHYNDAWRRFVAGEWTPDMSRYIHPSHERALADLVYLRNHNVGWTLSAGGRN